MGSSRFWAKPGSHCEGADCCLGRCAVLISFADETQVDKALTQLAAKVFALVAAYVKIFLSLSQIASVIGS